MKMTKIAFASMLTFATLPQLAQADEAKAGYYGAMRALDAQHKADNMDQSARPGIGEFVPGKDKREFASGSVAVGYALGNGWRTEGEYTFPRTNTYTSGSAAFVNSFNNHDVRSQRVMLNVYRDFAIADDWSIFGNAGIGIAQLRSGGWQGNDTRRYIDSTRNSLAWSVGAGVSYRPIERLAIDAGYRYVGMGTTDSGWNAFPNARGLQDEKMSLDLSSRELYLGARLKF